MSAAFCAVVTSSGAAYGMPSGQESNSRKGAAGGVLSTVVTSWSALPPETLPALSTARTS